MNDLPWAKMPSIWIARGELGKSFSSNKGISIDIAALKVFIALCLNATTITRKELKANSKTWDFYDFLEVRMTYDAIHTATTLSRKLISQGLKKLEELEIIVKEGNKRNIRYILARNLKGGWCKLPKRDLMTRDGAIKGFSNSLHRYDHERCALKIFLVLISFRNNNESFTQLKRGTICKKTNIDFDQLEQGINHLRSMGWIQNVESDFKEVSAKEWVNSQKDLIDRYYVIGWKTINIGRETWETANKNENKTGKQESDWDSF